VQARWCKVQQVKEELMSSVWYVDDFIILNDEGEVIWSEKNPKRQLISEELKRHLMNTYQRFYVCSEQVKPLFPGASIPSKKIGKLLIFAPTFEAAQKAARYATEMSGGVFRFWIEPA
jgi:hypothetical protein